MYRGDERWVLVLEDNEELLALQKIFIEQLCKCHAVLARSYNQLLEVKDMALQCKIAFLDINLGTGELTGVDAYHWLRSQQYTGTVYFLTGHGADFPPVADAVRLGDAIVLSKPVSSQQLIEIVESSNGNEFCQRG